MKLIDSRNGRGACAAKRLVDRPEARSSSASPASLLPKSGVVQPDSAVHRTSRANRCIEVLGLNIFMTIPDLLRGRNQGAVNRAGEYGRSENFPNRNSMKVLLRPEPVIHESEITRKCEVLEIRQSAKTSHNRFRNLV